MRDESREGVDWHRDGDDVPGWAIVLAAVAALALFCAVIGMIAVGA